MTPTRGAPGVVVRHGRTATVESDDEYQLVQEARPGVILFRYEGFLSMQLWSASRELMLATIARAGSLLTVTDGEMCAGSDPDLREVWSDFVREHRASVVGRYFLARSAMLRMAVQTTAMTSECPVKLYRERPDFIADVEAVLPGLDLTPLAARVRTR